MLIDSNITSDARETYTVDGLNSTVSSVLPGEECFSMSVKTRTEIFSGTGTEQNNIKCVPKICGRNLTLSKIPT